MYKDDCHGFDLVQDGGPNNELLLHKILPRQAFILRAIYSYGNEMKFWVINMYAENPNPSYPCFKYAKGFIVIRVSNVHN